MGVGTVLFPFPGVLLAMLLFSGTAAAQSSAVASSGAGVRRIEIPSRPSNEAWEVRISPEVSTTFLFDSELLGFELAGREGFTLVDPGQTTLRLVPSLRVALVDQLRLVVRLKDGERPASASFMLVVHPARAEPLVEVYRQRRPEESYRQEASEAREEARQCREENERLHAECKGAGGLRGVLATQVVGDKGVTARGIRQTATLSPASALSFVDVSSFRSAERVAIKMTLSPLAEGAAPWMAEGATLTSNTGEALRVLPVWQSEPMTSASHEPLVIVEAEALKDEARGPFTLKVWEAGGKRAFILGNVTFPEL